MVINHRQKFIFIHVPKTGGTSIRAALLLLPGSKAVGAHTKHLTASEFLARKPFWARGAGYKSIGFVRNPWDRTASLYRYLQKQGAKLGYDDIPPFADFLILLEENGSWVSRLHSARPQTEFFPSENCSIGRYENLANDFSAMMERYGLAISIPHLNASGPRIDYRLAYSDGWAEKLGAIYSADIERFGYSF